MTLIWIDYFLAGFFSAVAIFYSALILYKQKKQTTKQCVHIGNMPSLHWFNHSLFRLFRIAIWAYTVIRLFTPAIDHAIYQFAISQYYALRFIGAIGLIVGLIISMAGTFSMQNSWRSGIDPENNMTLVTTGLFRLSRNPTYLGVALGQFSFFIALPNTFTLVCLLVGWQALLLQIKLEEKHLTMAYGDEYRHYVNRVRRFI